ncbi:MAG TPA: hypothetical protein PK069_01005 [Methanolinea sp.]|nr:hypothetical protein [Methanolinea sp.]HQK55149.1 hypothetical protein [Methanolinea sp.]
MVEKEKPCCAAEALRRIRQVEVGGITVGLAMLDDIIDEVQELQLTSKEAIINELVKRIKIYNYIPSSAEEKYREAMYREYNKKVTP